MLTQLIILLKPVSKFLRELASFTSQIISTGPVVGNIGRITAGLKHRSQVRSGHRSGHKEEYFSAKEIDYIFGTYKNLVLSRELIM